LGCGVAPTSLPPPPPGNLLLFTRPRSFIPFYLYVSLPHHYVTSTLSYFYYILVFIYIIHFARIYYASTFTIIYFFLHYKLNTYCLDNINEFKLKQITMKKFNHFKLFSITLNVIYVVTQLSLFTFVINTILKTF
jgi:hypothetical protein